MRSFIQIIFVSSLSLLIGCAPSLGSSLRVNTLPEIDSRELKVEGGGRTVRIARIFDNRTLPIIVAINDRTIPSDGDLGATVQEAFEHELKAIGFSVSLFKGSRTLEGSITQWSGVVHPGFPTSEISCDASLSLRVLPESGEIPIYKGVYSGAVTLQHPFPSESVVGRALGQAMAKAVEEALNDEKLLKSLLEHSSASLSEKK